MYLYGDKIDMSNYFDILFPPEYDNFAYKPYLIAKMGLIFRINAKTNKKCVLSILEKYF